VLERWPGDRFAESRYAVGDHVVGMFGMQEYAPQMARACQSDPKLAPLPVYMGTTRMPGMTAYFGLLKLPRSKP